MRIRIAAFLLLDSITCFSQKQVAFAFPEYKEAFRDSAVLYRGYENLLVLEIGDSLVLESKQVSVTRSGAVDCVLRVSTINRTAELTVRNMHTGKVAETWQFQVRNLPAPVLSWGVYPDSSVVSMDQTILVANYGNNSLFEDPGFEIESYEISSLVLEHPIHVSGEVITREVVDALEKAKALNEGKPVVFGVMAKVRKKREGVLRKKSALFTY